MDAPTSQRPSLEEIRRLMRRHPEVPNAEWARRWGISRERVRQLRLKLKLPASADLRQRAREKRRSEILVERELRRQIMAAQTKPDPCPVCGGRVSGLRQVTCSPGCAERYAGNSKYRWRRDRGRTATG